MDLFKEDLKVPETVIYTPISKMFNYWKQLLGTHTVTDLKIMAELLYPVIRNKNITIDKDGSKLPVPEAVTKVIEKKNLTLKNDLTAFISFFLASRKNFQLYFNTLPTQEKEIWETAVREYFISETQINALARSTWIEPKMYSWRDYDRNISKRLVWFNYCCCKLKETDKYGFYKRGLYFTLQKDIFNLVSPYFSLPPVTFLMDALPENHGLHTFRAEEDIFLEYPLLESLYHSGVLNTGKPKTSFTTLKKILKRNHIKEFFPSTGNDISNMLRSYLLISCYTLNQMVKQKRTPRHIEEILQIILDTVPEYQELTLPILLPHLTGLQKKASQESYSYHLCAALRSLLSTVEKQWISVDSLCDTVLTSPSYHTLCKMFHPDMFDKMELKNNKQEHIIFIDRVYREVTVPYIKAFFFLMGALGGMELAYREPDANDPSYFDGLKYARLTELGRFLLGQTPKYNHVRSDEDKNRFELSTEKLIIRVTNERYEVLLSDIAVPLGNRRFCISHESFLKNCKTQKDITDKILFFKEHICSELPPNWENFFDRLAKRIDKIMPVYTQYEIYRINKEDKELQRLVSTDPVIRAHSLRAEGFLLLIEPVNFKTVSSRLKESGYWIEEADKRIEKYYG